MKLPLPAVLLLAAVVAVPLAALAKPPLWDKVIPRAQKRFKVLRQFAGEAVLDKETGLVWERTPGAEGVPWDGSWIQAPVPVGAIARCTTKFVGGRSGWRLATIEELASLLDPVATNPALPPGHPFVGIQAGRYWSLTPAPGMAAYVVDFIDGEIQTYLMNDLGRVWCVRGGHAFDARPQ